MDNDPRCSLGEDWRFDGIERRAFGKQGHQFEGIKFRSYQQRIAAAAYDLDEALREVHPNAPASARASFWQSYEVHRHLCMFAQQLIEYTDTLSAKTQMRLDHPDDAFLCAQKQIMNFARSLAVAANMQERHARNLPRANRRHPEVGRRVLPNTGTPVIPTSPKTEPKSLPQDNTSKASATPASLGTSDKQNLDILKGTDGELKRAVNLDVARRFGGVSRRAIEDAAHKGSLKTEGNRQQRRVLVDSLLEYFPPEKIIRSDTK